MPANNPNATSALIEPKPALYNCMKSLLTSMGIDTYEPPVVDMLIDFVYSYSKDVLQDAQAYGEAAGKAAGSIGSQDIELAIRSRSFAQPLSLQALKAIADELNKQELPAIEGRAGLPLASTGTLLVPNVQYGQDVNDSDGDEDMADSGDEVAAHAAQNGVAVSETPSADPGGA